MKKLLLLVVFLAGLSGSTFAQLNSNRTAATRVYDALAMLPAENEERLTAAMEDLVSAGRSGLVILTEMFDDVNNVPVNYALSGLASYVTGEGREYARQVYADGLLKALEESADLEIKAFYIRMLSLAGGDESVETLYYYLDDEYLSDPALKALVSIDTEESRNALLHALVNGRGSRLPLAYAAGDAGLKGGFVTLRQWLEGADDPLRKAIYYAMANSGDPAALDVLYKAAAAQGFNSSDDDAVSRYLEAMRNLAQEYPVKVSQHASRMMKAVKKNDPALRIAALEAYLAAAGKGGNDLILKAMDDPDRVYRQGILSLAAEYDNDDLYRALLAKSLKLKNTEAIEDVIYITGISGRREYVELLAPYVYHSNDDVAVAAMEAVTILGGSEVPRLLAGRLTDEPGERVFAAAQQNLLCVDQDITPVVTPLLQGNNMPARIAAIELLASKRATEYGPQIMTLTDHDNPEVSNAAYKALADVATVEQLPQLFDKVNNGTLSALHHARNAAISVLADLDQTNRKAVITQWMDKAGNRRPYYYMILTTVNTPESIETIWEGYNSGDPLAREQAMKALMAWKGLEAAPYLLVIAKGGEPGMLEEYISVVAASELTPERKLLMLDAAMQTPAGTTDAVRILREVSSLPLFQSMVLAGRYLDAEEPRIRDAAAQAVMDIALAGGQWYGPAVRELLERASEALNNSDSGYQRQAIAKHLAEMPREGGFVSLFNGIDLTGWKGLVEDPIKRAAMSPAQLALAQARADETMREEWIVEDGALVFVGKGYDNICTAADYGDFELYVDWMLYPDGPDADGGIYLRGTPQVQIWDIARTNVGAQVGSGGLYNNKKYESDPLVVADNPMGEWNTFFIKMKGERVTVYLNGDLVVDNIPLENYWDRTQPIFPVGQIELQAHGTRVAYKNIYLRELPPAEPYRVTDEERAEGFVELFDGTSLDNWFGNTEDYLAEDGAIVLYPSKGSGGNLYTTEQYGDFILRFEFMLTPAANNGIGIRTPAEGDAAYVGMEIQVLDDTAPVYANLEHYQYHGSVYGVIAAKRGYLKPLGEWNVEEIYANGNHIRVTLNGEVILDGDIAEASANGTLDGKHHPGLLNEKGHIAFLGHGSHVKFRNLRIKTLDR